MWATPVIPPARAVRDLTQVRADDWTKTTPVSGGRPATSAGVEVSAPPTIGRIEGKPMKRKASALALLAALGGCVSADKSGPAPSGGVTASRTVGQGPSGAPVQAAAARPRTANDPKGVVQASATGKSGGDVVQAN